MILKILILNDFKDFDFKRFCFRPRLYYFYTLTVNKQYKT